MLDSGEIFAIRCASIDTFSPQLGTLKS